MELKYNHHNQWNIVTMKSPSEEKIRLMSAMFHGRRDVFARRYERKDGRGGYAPVCSNEWVHGVCGKCAKVRGDCATCAARDFMPISDKVSAGERLFYLTVFDGRCDE